MYNRNRPGPDVLFDDDVIPRLMDWWRSHHDFRLGIFPTHVTGDAVTIVAILFRGLSQDYRMVLWL